ncbi:IclR family transcriptional regulator [Amycolatopsis sp. NPDC059027]|uniref:IclR family transcriptional regulator n=1 Tax=unclassified Amycolatopsis TaxID=2618356 RepID=UPI00366FF8D3
MADKAEQGVTVRSVERSLDILEILAAAPDSLSLTELSARSALPAPTILRLLRTLQGRGYVRQAGPRRYVLGSRARRLASAGTRAAGRTAEEFLRELVALSGETAKLTVLDGDDVLCVASVPSPHPVRMFTEAGARMMPHCTSAGKAMLAQLPPSEARELLTRTGLPAVTTATITDLEKMLALLGEVRSQGYALDDGERADDVCCVAVPVASTAGPAALSVSGPSSRMPVTTRRKLVTGMRDIAERFAAALDPAETVRQSG